MATMGYHRSKEHWPISVTIYTLKVNFRGGLNKPASPAYPDWLGLLG